MRLAMIQLLYPAIVRGRFYFNVAEGHRYNHLGMQGRIRTGKSVGFEPTGCTDLP